MQKGNPPEISSDNSEAVESAPVANPDESTISISDTAPDTTPNSSPDVEPEDTEPKPYFCIKMRGKWVYVKYYKGLDPIDTYSREFTFSETWNKCIFPHHFYPPGKSIHPRMLHRPTWGVAKAMPYKPLYICLAEPGPAHATSWQ